eukprot:10414-Heterococcus_DN1.PRE.3
MPGFTRSTFQRDPPQAITVLGTDKTLLKLPIVSPTVGGPSSYVRGQPGFTDSRLVFKMLRDWPAGIIHTWLIPRELNRIKAACGLTANRTDTTVEIVSTYGGGPGWSSKHPLLISAAIGQGCSGALKNCNGNGKCDNCLEQCICKPEAVPNRSELLLICTAYRVNGSAVVSLLITYIVYCAALLTTQYNACMSLEQAQDGTLAQFDPNKGHVQEECSGVGVCDRKSGSCRCPTGYSGRACQRKDCPNNCSLINTRFCSQSFCHLSRTVLLLATSIDRVTADQLTWLDYEVPCTARDSAATVNSHYLWRVRERAGCWYKPVGR